MSAIHQLLAAYPATAAGFRYWRINVTAPTSSVSISELKIVESTGSLTSLVGKTVTVVTGDFTTYPIANINDGVAETSNATNIANSGASAFSVYVDLGAAYNVTAFDIAPQGFSTFVFNTPTAFQVQASNDASAWTTKATFTGITATYPDWTAGTYRRFSW